MEDHLSPAVKTRDLMCLVLALIVCLASLHGQVSLGSWDELEEHEGARIEVLLTGGQVIAGRLQDAGEDFLLLQTRGQLEGIEKDAIYRIYEIRRSARLRNMALGAALGVAGAELAGIWVSAAGDDIELTSRGVAGMAILGAGLGDIVGLAVSSPEAREVIFER